MFARNVRLSSELLSKKNTLRFFVTVAAISSICFWDKIIVRSPSLPQTTYSPPDTDRILCYGSAPCNECHRPPPSLTRCSTYRVYGQSEKPAHFSIGYSADGIRLPDPHPDSLRHRLSCTARSWFSLLVAHNGQKTDIFLMIRCSFWSRDAWHCFAPWDRPWLSPP